MGSVLYWHDLGVLLGAPWLVGDYCFVKPMGYLETMRVPVLIVLTDLGNYISNSPHQSYA